MVIFLLEDKTLQFLWRVIPAKGIAGFGLRLRLGVTSGQAGSVKRWVLRLVRLVASLTVILLPHAC